jgi:DNA-binding transcriptional LysR family regulator
MDSRSLAIFLAVCETRNMTVAARRLGVTQGAVSQQIARLESSLGLRLLDRDGKELTLLPAGLLLRHHACRVRDEMRACERAMERFSGFSFPSLSVSIMETLGRALTGVVVDVLHGATQQVQLHASVSYQHQEDILSGRADLVVSAQSFDGDFFEVHPLADEMLVLVAPKSVVSDAGPVDLETLAGRLPIVRFAHQRKLARMTDDYLASQAIFIERSIEIDQAQYVIDFVRRGQAWAITTPFSLLESTLDMADIDVLELPPHVPLRRIVLVSRAGALGDLPGIVADRCREQLRIGVAGRLAALVPTSACPVIHVGTNYPSIN